MNIKVKNNKNGRIENEDVVKVAEHYLRELIGEEKVKNLGTVEITFKKLVSHRGGYLRTKRGETKKYWIAVNSTRDLNEQLSTIAHECVHVKQYFTGELTQTIEFSRGRAKHIRTWKGRTYLRKKYWDRPWEKEARKFQDKLSYNILNRINKPVALTPKAVVIPRASANIGETVLNILRGSDLPNGDLVPKLLEGSTDIQKRIRVLKEVFALKQSKVIEEFNVNGAVWVRAV